MLYSAAESPDRDKKASARGASLLAPHIRQLGRAHLVPRTLPGLAPRAQGGQIRSPPRLRLRNKKDVGRKET